MKFARALRVGERFRPACLDQPTRNDREMRRDTVYLVTKTFAQSPHFVVSVEDLNQSNGIYVLGPGVPVVSQMEPDPTVEGIEEFLEIKPPTKRIAGIRLIWDGTTRINHLCTKQDEAIMRLLAAGGKREYTTAEIRKLMVAKFHEFWKGRIKYGVGDLFLVKYKGLAEVGLIEKIVEERTNVIK